jgi:hypothetical protein
MKKCISHEQKRSLHIPPQFDPQNRISLRIRETIGKPNTSTNTSMVNTPTGEPWFKARDVAERLGYSAPSKVISDHVEDADRLFYQNDKKIGRPSINISIA